MTGIRLVCMHHGVREITALHDLVGQELDWTSRWDWTGACNLNFIYLSSLSTQAVDGRIGSCRNSLPTPKIQGRDS